MFFHQISSGRWRPSSSIVVLGLLVLAGCSSENAALEVEPTAAQLAALRPQVVAFCGGCHNTPDPKAFPKDRWHHEVQQGFDFYFASNRKDLHPPVFNDVVKWFRSQAPATLKLEAPVNSPSPLRFRQEHQANDAKGSVDFSGVSHVLWRGTAVPANERLLFCDMRQQGIHSVGLADGRSVTRELLRLNHPAHIEVTDLDQDGERDFVVADLGTFLPQDHTLGRVVWVRLPSSGEPLSTVLLDKVGRVADVRPGDFDNDGDIDLIVAEFGWRKTGRVLLLRQIGREAGVPHFQTEVIDERHGTIHVPPVDLDGDGDLDFVALVSQEFEEIDAFLNRGDGTFERQIIQLAGDPAFGSSGIQLIDFDHDGDWDVLYSNGDSLDSKLLKPYHGLQWLENEGDFPFRSHRLTDLPGASRALAADFDSDGDLDVVATAWVPDELANEEHSATDRYDSLIWLEQIRAGEFARHSISSVRRLGYLAFDLGDLDDDGDLDVIAGFFGKPSDAPSLRIDVFWNDSSARDDSGRGRSP